MRLRAATLTDGYKIGHGGMYADGTESVYSNLTPRSDKIYRRNCTQFFDGRLVWIGGYGAMQEIHEHWEAFFASPREEVVGQYANRMMGYFGSLPAAVGAIGDLHDLGYLPLRVKALKEGSKVGMGIPVLTITNTLPAFYWLVNYHETLISDLTWKPATNATIAAEYKAICTHYAKLTGCYDEFAVGIQCHDFSMRGMSGPEDAARSGFGHITSFLGTDTLPAIDYAEDYYHAEGFIACSVPATEHAVATSNILAIENNMQNKGHPNARLAAEIAFMHDLITRKVPAGVVSYVADSFDYWAVITEVLPILKDVIMARTTNGVTPGKLVVRPDSGDPVDVICGMGHVEEVEDLSFYTIANAVEAEAASVIKFEGKYYIPYRVAGDWHDSYEVEEVSEAEVKGSIECLWETFGGTTTPTGHKLLDEHIGLIYGDSITTKRAEEILRRLADKGFASTNVVFGVGSYTYQCNTRDTFGFAVKATHTTVNGQDIAIFKDPKTDAKKKSAKGRLMVIKSAKGEYELFDDVSEEFENAGELLTLYEDGNFVRKETLMSIREELSKGGNNAD